MSTPISDLARRLAYANDFRLGEQDVRTLQDAIVERDDVSDEDRRNLRAFLQTNNGEMFPAAQRERIMTFLDLPAHDLRAMALAAERDDGVIDEADAKALLKHAGKGGLEGREKYSLESMRAAFNVDPRAEKAIRRRTQRLSFDTVLDKATADGTLTEEEYAKDVRPGLLQTPQHWTPQGQRALEARLSGGVAMKPSIRNDLDNVLAGRGFDIEHGETLEGVEALHVSAPDRTFERYARILRLDDDAKESVGVIDGGFDVEQDLMRAKIDVNEGEIPNNDIDDDGNGYTDDYFGANRMGMTRGKPSSSHDDLDTWERFSYHGNQTATIATRGTDRLQAIAVADSDGSVAGGIDYAVSRGARIINISQSFEPDATEKVLEAIDRHPNVLFVHSAGNAGHDLDADPTQGDLTGRDRPNLLHVAAADIDGSPLESTNRGASAVHVAAQAKFRAPVTASDSFDSGVDEYVYGGKTSQAAPNVANVAAKMKLLAPSLGPEQVKGMLIDSSRRDPRWQGLVASGGRVDADRALGWAAAQGLVDKGIAPDRALRKLGLTGDLADFVRARLVD